MVFVVVEVALQAVVVVVVVVVDVAVVVLPPVVVVAVEVAVLSKEVSNDTGLLVLLLIT